MRPDVRQCKSRLQAALVAILVVMSLPAAAQAHGPLAPYGSSYLARVASTPPGTEAKATDGDQRMWLRVPANEPVIVFDYRGAPYLRFSVGGVAVNRNSAMFYLNQNPAQNPPPGLSPAAPPRWQRVTGAHAYSWHDGRLHALAAVALRPGATFVGIWRIPISLDGRRTAISGGLWHADNPSIVWFWPIVVLLACALAVARARRHSLEAVVSRALVLVALAATGTLAAGAELYGRPDVVAGQLVVLGLVLAFVGYGLVRVLLGRAGGFHLFVISFVALWAGGALVTVLVNGFVLMAVPAFIARTAVVLALGCGGGLFVMLLGRMDRTEEEPAAAGGDVAERAVR
ncbi:MAG TPA: hypothetical protein VGF81_16740 [Solirubrobacteraceae bacterium]